MSQYVENFKEKEERWKYSRQIFWLRLLVIFVVSYAVLSIFFFSHSDTIFVFLNVPNSKAIPFYTLGLFLLLAFRFWWKGIPHPLAFVLRKTPVLSDLIPESAYKGKEKELNDFFYQEVEINDFVPKGRGFKFFHYKGDYDISTLFDFNPETGEKEPGRTNEIIMAFRDFRRERIEAAAKRGKNKKEREKARKALRNYDEKYRKSGIPSPEQEKMYEDLMLALEGVLQGYVIKNREGEVLSEIKNKRIKPPIRLAKRKKGEGGGSRIIIDEKISMVKLDKVYFSMRALMETVRSTSILFSEFLSMALQGQGRITYKYGKELSDPRIRRKVLTVFQFVFFRRLLGNYGSMPSGWFVVRMDDYEYRSVISAVDRDMIPTITSANDGSNDLFGDDRFAALFLFLYQAFLNDPLVSPTIDAIDWAFNTTKDINEIKMREFVKKIEKESEDKQA